MTGYNAIGHTLPMSYLNGVQALEAAITYQTESFLIDPVLALLSGERAAHLGGLYYVEQTPLMSLEPWVNQGTPTNFFNRETTLLHEILPSIHASARSDETLVDLGPGSPSSVERRAVLIAQALEVTRYVPVDISRAFLATAREVFGRRLPNVVVHPIRADFFDPSFKMDTTATFIYMGGSTISNLPLSSAKGFPAEQYAQYLKAIASLLTPEGRLLVGWHSARDGGFALAPYSGAEARYYLETPLRVMTELGASGLTTNDWEAESIWCGSAHCVSHGLRAKRNVTVQFAGRIFSFRLDDRLEITPSYKIPTAKMRDMMSCAGMHVLQERGQSDGYVLWLLGKGTA